MQTLCIWLTHHIDQSSGLNGHFRLNSKLFSSAPYSRSLELPDWKWLLSGLHYRIGFVRFLYTAGHDWQHIHRFVYDLILRQFKFAEFVQINQFLHPT